MKFGISIMLDSQSRMNQTDSAKALDLMFPSVS